ncbi:MAG TPA: hypothetical protein PLH94_09220 [Fimbriimonadaceae bacterium]|nr:hypothetical protein [Fimbriimonadaceae bacterium]
MKSRLLVVLILVALAIVAFAQEAVSLKRSAKLGDTAKYKMTVKVLFGDLEYSVTSANVVKVTKVAEDGAITSSSKQTDIKIKVKGMEGDYSAPDQEIIATRTPNGELLTLSAEKVDATSYRLENLAAFRAPEEPVKPGDKWVVDLKPDEKTGTVSAKASYEVLGFEKVGPYATAKIKWSYTETEGDAKASSEGTVWIWTLDGSLVKAEGKLKNAPFRDAPRPVDVDILTEREP